MKKEQNKYNQLWLKEWGILYKIGPSVRSRNRVLLRLIKKYPMDGVVLDSGCGDGTFLDILHREYGKKLDYEGADISNVATELTQSLGFVKQTYIMNLENKNGFPKQKYDIVISSEVLEHISDWKLAVANLSSILNPKGFLFITVPHGMKYWNANDKFANQSTYEMSEIFNKVFNNFVFL